VRAGRARRYALAHVSRLRAKCPDCRTNTAVALGGDYECHSCGRTFPAGLVRVPRAWGDGGEPMVEAALLPLPYPETSVIAEDSIRAQSLALAAELPDRPLVLGGCCCAHVGAVEGLAARHERVALVWLDAHGDLNTPETSPSGNAWGMPLRMLIDAGTVDADDVALVGARSLDAPEEEFIESAGVHRGPAAVEHALDSCSCIYVALDVDSLESSEVRSFMPEPDGLRLREVEELFDDLRRRTTVLGAGLTGLAPDPANVAPLTRLCRALGF
jgi:arginase